MLAEVAVCSDIITRNRDNFQDEGEIIQVTVAALANFAKVMGPARAFRLGHGRSGPVSTAIWFLIIAPIVFARDFALPKGGRSDRVNMLTTSLNSCGPDQLKSVFVSQRVLDLQDRSVRDFKSGHQDNKFLAKFWSLPDRNLLSPIVRYNITCPNIACCAKKAYQKGERAASWQAGLCIFYETRKARQDKDSELLLTASGLLVGRYALVSSRGQQQQPESVDRDTAKSWLEMTGKCDMIVALPGETSFHCVTYGHSLGSVLLFRAEDNWHGYDQSGTDSNNNGNNTSLSSSLSRQNLSSEDILASKFWRLNDRDMPGMFDKTDFVSPSVASCAKSAYRDGVKLAVWHIGRCHYKQVQAANSRLLDSSGRQIGRYNIPFYDVDSPVARSTFRVWLEKKKNCDMFVTNPSWSEFWCKRYVRSNQTVILFRSDDAEASANELQFEPTDGLVSDQEADEATYLAKFWPLPDRDLPGQRDKPTNFESNSVAHCAKRAYHDGEKLVIWHERRCFYKQIDVDASRVLARDGHQIGRYNIPMSDIDSPADVSTARAWIRDQKCDMIIGNSNWTDLWCKRYTYSPATIMLFKIDDETSDLGPPSWVSNSSGLSHFWTVNDRDMPGADRYSFVSPSVSHCAHRSHEDGVKLSVWRGSVCFFKETSGSRDGNLLNRYGDKVASSYDVPNWDSSDSPSDENSAQAWKQSDKCDMIYARADQYWCKRYQFVATSIILFSKD